ncbi:MAG TPA: bifunctional DNA-binding transcriptional regulator/O6-methylguanine-DNA methyltransferase Ada [Aliidongia sp.]|uniref:bifunctional DNA-binding transcriptional regulator/O6-methylguanine-DNA methyltransferase Ada n=1 Tax=Aliidongia sp. TaxID=1914230 RepID=UPI002DDD2214|nr:bifunctional DNA-binding transcriptional regulator/O6-methylguanine-DNA methyltransferase Ada [Aliidongia sp.]HEV2677562.1 bifunctional DNA-binding transcriptional regulator/O6-methylguanine-DNA methyltransferase Ada [Aliidongia sp.]
MQAMTQEKTAPAIEAKPFASDEARWQAVCDRNRAADGQFYFAVATTGVYCRPNCAARQPRRENVRFYDTIAAAEAAGFRACKRCRPTGKSIEQTQADAVQRACRMIDEAETPPTLNVLAEAVGMSPFHFHRVFKAVLGLTPKDYAAARRLERLKQELDDGTPVSQAIYGAGFGSSSRLYETTHATLGMTPAAFQRGAKGKQIDWTVTATALGPLLIAATGDGVCMIEFGENEAVLEGELAQRFPSAQRSRADAALDRHVAAVTAYIETPSRGLSLPLDVQGTAFQRRVWRALQEIPPGRTASYGEVAATLGQPTAARAVARACATNEIALAIPCHRVVGSDGRLAGYRWGLERKRALLAGEKKAG